EEVRCRRIGEADSLLEVHLAEDLQPIRLPPRNRLQQHRAHNAEHGAVNAYTQTKHGPDRVDPGFAASERMPYEYRDKTPPFRTLTLAALRRRRKIEIPYDVGFASRTRCYCTLVRFS